MDGLFDLSIYPDRLYQQSITEQYVANSRPVNSLEREREREREREKGYGPEREISDDCVTAWKAEDHFFPCSSLLCCPLCYHIS